MTWRGEIRRVAAARPVQLMGPIFSAFWRLPNGKQDSNLPDLTDVGWEYPDATFAESCFSDCNEIRSV